MTNTPPAFSFQFRWSVSENAWVMPLRSILRGVRGIMTTVNNPIVTRTEAWLGAPSFSNSTVPLGAGRCGVYPPSHSAPLFSKQFLTDFVNRFPIPHSFVSSLIAEWKRNRGIFSNEQKSFARGTKNER